MEDPAKDVPRVVRELCEPVDANKMTAAVDKYFADDAVFVCQSAPHRERVNRAPTAKINAFASSLRRSSPQLATRSRPRRRQGGVQNASR